MSSSEESVERVSPASHSQTSLSGSAKQQSRWLGVLATLLCAVIAGLIIHLWFEHQQEMRLREEVARRFQTGDSVNLEVRGIAKSMQNTVLDLQAKVTALENAQLQTQSQYDSLEQMYLEFAKNRDDRILTDIEQILLMANQQLQLTGNVHGALIALESADKFLSRGDKPQFIGIRKALLKDIEKLRSVPYVDVSGMAIKLDSVLHQIKLLPLLSDARIKPVSTQNKNASDQTAQTKEGKAKDSEETSFSETWKKWNDEFWNEVKGLVHVRNVTAPDALVLSPSQVYFLQENLALRILGARIAMMARDHTSFASDMTAAIKIIDTYYDLDSPQVKTVKETLKQVMNSNIAVKIPALSESMMAIQSYQAKP